MFLDELLSQAGVGFALGLFHYLTNQEADSDHQLLEKYSEGLIVLSGCIGGEVGDALRQNQYDKAKEIAAWYKSVFGDRYYLEIQDHGHIEHPSKWDEQVIVTQKNAATS